MKRPKYTIAGLLGLTLFLGVFLAAMREATEVWDSGVFGVTLGLLTTSILLATHRRGHQRAFWMGFAVFGGAYLLFSLIPSVESRLPITRGLAFIDSRIPGRLLNWPIGNSTYLTTIRVNPAPVVNFSPNGNILHANPSGAIRLWDTSSGLVVTGSKGSTENFIRIGHSLIALLLAVIGALLSRTLHVAGQTLIDENTVRGSRSDAPPPAVE